MSYLWIREDDSKTFRSFLSGNEIEVGFYVQGEKDVFGPGEEIEIFYGDESTDTYKAEIKRQRSTEPAPNSGKSFLMLSLVKV